MIRRLAVLFLLGVSAASAQEVMAPKVITTSDARPNVTATAPTGQGSMWIDSGGSSPLEKDFCVRFFAEQGVVVRTFAGFDVGAYVNTTDSMDQHRLDWNRFARGSAGLKLVKTFNNRYFGGLLRGDVGYTAEHRFISGTSAAAPSLDINYWIGWQPQQGRLPGSSWGIAALNISPTELHNTLFNDFVKQGVVLWKEKDHGMSRPKPELIAFGQMTLSKDMLGYDWNNFTREGGGLEIMVPTEHSTYEVGTMYLYETRSVIPRTGSGVEIFIRFWHGWQDSH
ncbi:MAG: hypothetical protein JO119_03665 [Acidobacteria bacterium]|nr:hypothetical protein [Acidobacteriota bacterium]